MCSDFTIDLGRKDSIRLHDSHDECNWTVTLAFTGEQAKTGARIRRAACYLDDDDLFCVTYGDGVSDVDLGATIRSHRQRGLLATVTGVHPTSRFGELTVENGLVSAFTEKPQTSEGYINGGFFVFSKPFLDYLSKDDTCALEADPLERCAREGQLGVHVHDGFWQCMDTHRDWLYLERLWHAGDAPWKVWG
jgi:glucose-1-phosphate cytidylyltransferase